MVLLRINEGEGEVTILDPELKIANYVDSDLVRSRMEEV